MRESSEHIVYHVTTADRAEACLREGLIPRKTSLASDRSTAMDIAYDAARPPHVLEAGVSRTGAIYAHPDLQDALKKGNGGWLNRTQRQLVALAIYVPNLEQAYVADGLLNAEPFKAEDYWPSFTTLAHFRSQDVPVFEGPDRYNAGHTKRYVYRWPEVLIPDGVSADRIALLAPRRASKQRQIA